MSGAGVILYISSPDYYSYMPGTPHMLLIIITCADAGIIYSTGDANEDIRPAPASDIRRRMGSHTDKYHVCVFTVIMLFSFFSGCVGLPANSNISIPPVTSTPLPIGEYYKPMNSSASTMIFLEPMKNITVYVPVWLDENMTVLEMYNTPVTTDTVTTAIIDTEHGKALKINKSGRLNRYGEGNYVSFTGQYGLLKEDVQTSEKFFRRFKISMSNYTPPEHFIDSPYFGRDSKVIDAWVYSDNDVNNFGLSFFIDPRNRINRIALSIDTEGVGIHLRKGWQIVKLSLQTIAWD